jgi:hypothetical protein
VLVAVHFLRWNCTGGNLAEQAVHGDQCTGERLRQGRRIPQIKGQLRCFRQAS